jgi:predicted Holliday junction resolvase-like endonuclease
MEPYKDPIHYFFIVPVALLLIQLILFFTYNSIKQWLLVKLRKLHSNLYKSPPTWRRTSLREAALKAEQNRKQRIINNHAKLLKQEETKK